MNILFIMCDQLRADYLSCYGHPHLETPNIDALAAQGVRFNHAYCQDPLCGPSRASFYTGRYVSSHGVMANDDPLRIGELTLGDYLRDTGMQAVVVGKSEGKFNAPAALRFHVAEGSEQEQCLRNNGFTPYELFAGLYPDPILPADLGYSDYLRGHGLGGDNPWETWANSALDDRGEIVSGWQMRNARLAARVPEAHSETAFVTDRAIEYLDGLTPDDRWCMHLSYIKPHWPYLAPAPYHELYGPEQVLPTVRSDQEKENPHPVYQAFMAQDYSENFSRDEVRQTVIPAYMGLIQQLDHHIGRVLTKLEHKGLRENTLIVLTSDHGDYLGDHWLGEKDLYHEPAIRIPLIISDPSPAADATRGRVDDHLVESIDLVPTFVESAGGAVSGQRMEGRSLLPLLHDPDPALSWREFAVSEIDFGDRGPRELLDVHPYECRAWVIRTAQWKYILHQKFRPQLFNLLDDPDEFHDLGSDPACRSVCEALHEMLFGWQRTLKSRTEVPTGDLMGRGPKRDEADFGILIGRW
ncbi:MAG TPA: phosphonate monoester hydrolase [Gammaproteobacteria bacterium]|jgi:arylsulfatase A-like enzyme|nr:phosphonate monoester hydrolase [Acidiferrobacteraceae bacterium]MDP6398261.1 sulfatase-like hydrolase/transferase [Arenicellales bacterium]MDP6552098.1 sulfatase-like hydrolase/transferase [Arenicellales bacterium]MDP6918044.1 sulfatase-like hydrolase/transferase [Arenicellales bacterium]HCX88826.1 phosphonate monoester hydrolase [Gammaproteobacteria bacterium]|tara:strand:- start:1580 stop:3154 length:1575 start_codon:yes stop_codon:yes gene_type:complete